MTLAKGNRLIKLDAGGEPIRQGEVYVEWEVDEITTHFNATTRSREEGEEPYDVYVVTLLRKVR
jgi:hypothetical protein